VHDRMRRTQLPRLLTMGKRDNNQTRSARLSIKKETLRALQLRTLSDDELRAVPGGMGTAQCGGASENCAPSCRGC
jgi:hypothetical protein